MPKQIPFFRLLIPFIIGILFALNFPFAIAQVDLILILTIFFCIVFSMAFLLLNWGYRWIFGVTLSIFLFFSGIAITDGIKSESEIAEGEGRQVLVRLLEPPEARTSSIRLLGKAVSSHSEGAWQSINEKVMLYFSSNDSMAKSLKYGDMIAIKASFNSPPKPLNPHQFNYRDYLSKKQVHRVAFVSSDHWIFVGYSQKWLFSKAFKLRDQMLTLFQSVGIEGENLGVLSALTMGYKSFLDQETRRVFSASGAMHILAVSGLHVGILFTTLSAFLFFLNRDKRGRLIKAFALILFLWFFAIFTGLSPSVIRASLMFSLVIIGTALSRKTSIYNTLCASAFIILTANPMLITEVGFQLSYLAVLSIVFFYPHIYKLIYIKNQWIDKVWTLICVSLAAQLGTFVLGLYYFNQFPNYFLLTNLYAIPLAFIILYLAIGLVVFSPVPIIAMGVGWLLNQVLSLLSFLIRFTESLPYSTISGVSISSTQLFYLVVAIILLALFLELRRLIFIYGLMSFLLIFFLERAYLSFERLGQCEALVFANRQSTLIGFRQGREFLLTTSDTSGNQSISKYSFEIDGYLNRVGVKSSAEIAPFTSLGCNNTSFRGLSTFYNPLGYWFSFKGKTILFPIGDDFKNYSAELPLLVNILVIGNQSPSDFRKIISLIIPETLVVDASVPVWRIEQIQEYAKTVSINTHIVATNGAFIF